MRHFKSTTIALLFLFGVTLEAQEGEKYGFLNIMNAVPEGGVCQITIGGQKIHEDGFKPGDFSGGLVLKTGSQSLEIDFDGLEPVTGSVEIEEGITSSYAIFNQNGVDKTTGERTGRIRITRLQPKTSDGYHLEAMSLSEDIVRIQVSQKPVELKYLKTTEIPGWNGGGLTVAMNANKLGTLAVEEKGNYIILVGKNSKNKEGVFFFRHFDFELPAWFRNPAP